MLVFACWCSEVPGRGNAREIPSREGLELVPSSFNIRMGFLGLGRFSSEMANFGSRYLGDGEAVGGAVWGNDRC